MAQRLMLDVAEKKSKICDSYPFPNSHTNGIEVFPVLLKTMRPGTQRQLL